MFYEQLVVRALNDVPAGFARVIIKRVGDIRSYGRKKSINDTNEGSHVINDLCVGAWTLGNREVYVVMRLDQYSELQIKKYDGKRLIFSNHTFHSVRG